MKLQCIGGFREIISVEADKIVHRFIKIKGDQMEHSIDPLKSETLEMLSEKVHDAYLKTCKHLGWKVNEANKVPYSDLPEDAKTLDRMTVIAVIKNLPK